MRREQEESLLDACSRADIGGMRAALEQIRMTPALARRMWACAALSGQSETFTYAVAQGALMPSGQAFALASSLRLAPEALRILAESASNDVRAAVAANVMTPPDVLGRLAYDDNYWCESAALSNPSTPAEVLLQFVQETVTEEIRTGVSLHVVARNPSLPVEGLALLADHPEYSIRRIVALNPSTPLDLLDRLALDTDSSVRDAVAESCATRASAITRPWNDGNLLDGGVEERLVLAQKPEGPRELLLSMLHDAAPAVRMAAARSLAEEANRGRISLTYRQNHDQHVDQLLNRPSETPVCRILRSSAPLLYGWDTHASPSEATQALFERNWPLRLWQAGCSTVLLVFLGTFLYLAVIVFLDYRHFFWMYALFFGLLGGLCAYGAYEAWKDERYDRQIRQRRRARVLGGGERRRSN